MDHLAAYNGKLLRIQQKTNQQNVTEIQVETHIFSHETKQFDNVDIFTHKCKIHCNIVQIRTVLEVRTGRIVVCILLRHTKNESKIAYELFVIGTKRRCLLPILFFETSVKLSHNSILITDGPTVLWHESLNIFGNIRSLFKSSRKSTWNFFE